VLFCYEAVDEYVMSNVREFDGKKLTGADHADVKLTDLPEAAGGRPHGGPDQGTRRNGSRTRSANASPR
jgi:HSP90 family molecular chaperone